MNVGWAKERSPPLQVRTICTSNGLCPEERMTIGKRPAPGNGLRIMVGFAAAQPTLQGTVANEEKIRRSREEAGHVEFEI